MNATLVDLRYRTKDLMRAIERQETVKIFAHGKLKAELVPAGAAAPKKKARMSAMEHPLFGSRKADKEPVHDVVRRLRAGVMIIDTDVLIEIERSNERVTRAFDAVEERAVSGQTWMEWVQGSRDKAHLRRIKLFIKDMGIEIVPIDQSISHRAMALIEEHGLKDGLKSGDALIAATALVRDEPLFTLNRKHFKPVRGLDLHKP